MNPFWAIFLMIVAAALGILFLWAFAAMVAHESEENEAERQESRYHNAEQALCEKRKAIITTGLGRPSKSLTPAEWQRLNDLKAQSADLFANGLPSEQPVAQLREKRAR